MELPLYEKDFWKKLQKQFALIAVTGFNKKLQRTITLVGGSALVLRQKAHWTNGWNVNTKHTHFNP